MDRADARELQFFERAVSRSRSSGVASARAFSISRRRRSFISPAAFSVNVTATVRASVPSPLRISPTMRPTSAVVLPVPAAASTKRSPNSVRIGIALLRRQGRSWQCPDREGESSFPAACAPSGTLRTGRRRLDSRSAHIAAPGAAGRNGRLIASPIASAT